MDNEEGGKIIRKDRVGVEKVMGYKIQLWEIVLVVNMKVYWKRFHPCEVGGTGPLIIKWKVKERGEIDTCCLYNSLQKYMAFIKNVLIWEMVGGGGWSLYIMKWGSQWRCLFLAWEYVILKIIVFSGGSVIWKKITR